MNKVAIEWRRRIGRSGGGGRWRGRNWGMGERERRYTGDEKVEKGRC